MGRERKEGREVMDSLYSCHEQRVYTVGNDISVQTFQF